MLRPWQFWTVTIVAVLAVVLAAINIVLFSQNRERQAEIAGRAQYVQQSIQLEALYRELFKERDAMRETFAAQEKPVQDSKKLRDALERLARETALLADKGNPNAKLIVDELKKRGITINPNFQPPANKPSR